MLELYKNIKKKRCEMGFTQSELAEKMGYADKSMIAKIEKGIIDLPQSKIVAFAEALETTPANLMGWEDVFTPETAILHAHMTEDLQFTELYKIWVQLNDTGKQKLMDNATDLVQIYKKG